MQFLSDKLLAERFSVSRATIWRWTALKKLPQPVKLAAGTTRWRLADIEQFEAQQGGEK
ncbi:helix-turn-helix transcriptional regulator [Alishewanella longhuensis]